MLIIVQLISLISVVLGRQSSVVQTNYGFLQGERKYFNDNTYDVFLGVPYAAPPLGDLRWTKPQPPASWQGIREAIAFGNQCTQFFRGNSSEDCLYLNVYVPNGVQAITEPLPVMVYSHGGAFIVGNGDRYPSEELATFGQVIVVTYNYRLSTLGFITTNDDNALGNYGLWDQTEALKWISENIVHFGGDPGRVTLFGQSAGGASVSHLLLSPESNQYFQRAIPLSGSAAAYWGTAGLQREATRLLALTLGCNILTDAAMMRCLRQKDPNQLDIIGLAVPVVLQFGLPNWVPIVDGDFHKSAPRSLIEAGYNSNHDLIFGSTFHDAATFVHYGLFTLADTDFIINTAFSFVLSPYSNSNELAALISHEYPQLFNEDILIRRQTLVRMATDFLFTSPAVYEAEQHSRTTTNGKKTYLYEFKHNRSYNPPSQAPWIIADHGEDIDFIFGTPHLRDYEFTQEERALNLAMMSYYTNFAYTGNPNEGPHRVDLEWPEYDEISRNYLMQKPQLEVLQESEDRVNRMSFWNDIFYPAAQPKNGEPTSIDSTINIKKIEIVAKKLLRWAESAEDDSVVNIAQFYANLLKDVVIGQS